MECNCDGTIIEDWVDIDLDRGCQIYYCTECYTTYTFEQYNDAISKQKTHQSHLKPQ